MRGWALFGGQLGGRSETTSDSGRERFLSCLALGCVLRNSILLCGDSEETSSNLSSL